MAKTDSTDGSVSHMWQTDEMDQKEAMIQLRTAHILNFNSTSLLENFRLACCCKNNTYSFGWRKDTPELTKDFYSGSKTMEEQSPNRIEKERWKERKAKRRGGKKAVKQRGRKVGRILNFFITFSISSSSVKFPLTYFLSFSCSCLLVYSSSLGHHPLII